MAFLKCMAVFVAMAQVAYGFSCPANTEELKLKYDQLENFDYYEGCDFADTTYQNALLGSMTNLDCGVNGNPNMYIIDPVPFSTNYIKKMCLNVHGANSVTIDFSTQTGADIQPHVEDLSGITGWHRFCIETGDEFQAYAWYICVDPKDDGSEVKVKNTKLAVCRFFIEP